MLLCVLSITFFHFWVVNSKVQDAVFHSEILWLNQLKTNAKSLIQVTNGHSMLELVENEEGYIDCNIIDDKSIIEQFIRARDSETSSGNVLENLKLGHVMPQDVFRHFSQECDHLQRRNLPARRRPKRFIFPGTNWCGKGNRAEFVNDFGVSAKADRCCLEHDGCPYIIQGLSNRYNYFNYRLHTLSYCDCDIKFKECLAKADTSTSHMVSKVYFGVMGQTCFELQREQVCKDRSWWGYCNQWRSDLVAHVIDTPI